MPERPKFPCRQYSAGGETIQNCFALDSPCKCMIKKDLRTWQGVCKDIIGPRALTMLGLIISG